MTLNRPTLDDLLAMEAGAIASLPTVILALLEKEADDAAARAKRIKDHLDGALDLKFGARAATARRAEGKDTGTVRIEDGDYVVVADLPKRVRWDRRGSPPWRLKSGLPARTRPITSPPN